MFHRVFVFQLETNPNNRETQRLSPFIYGPALITEVSWDAQVGGAAFDLYHNGQAQSIPLSLQQDIGGPPFFEHIHSSATPATAGERGDRMIGQQGIRTIRTRIPVNLPYFTISIRVRALGGGAQHFSGYIKVVELIPPVLFRRMALVDQ